MNDQDKYLTWRRFEGREQDRLCGQCKRIVSLGRNGLTLVRHMDTTHDAWCYAAGTMDWAGNSPDVGIWWKLRRASCAACHRWIGLDSSGCLLAHWSGEKGDPVMCEGAGMPAPEQDPTDNTTQGGTSWGIPSDLLNKIADAFEKYATGGPEHELATWWREISDAEIDMVVSKAIEYGATDLRDLGLQILEMAGRARTDDDGYATEIGIVFYAQGKLARIVAAVKEGRRPSYDSWLDLGIYARMAQRVHLRGGWPGVDRHAD